MSSKHVQTEIPETLYEPLRRRAERSGRPIKVLVREAIERYLEQEAGGDDPLLAFVGAGSLDDDAWSERKDWRTAPSR